MLADLANAYRLRGHFSVALSTADDAINISITRHTRVAECLARIVRAQTLLVSEGIELVEEELRRVRTLIEETGAAIYEPLLEDLENKLTSLGAPHGVQIASRPGVNGRGRVGTTDG